MKDFLENEDKVSGFCLGIYTVQLIIILVEIITNI